MIETVNKPYAKTFEKFAIKDPNILCLSADLTSSCEIDGFRDKNPTKFIYHLHGCSDKGYHSGWIAPKSHFLDVDQVLFYGKRMQDVFKDNQVLKMVLTKFTRKLQAIFTQIF